MGLQVGLDVPRCLSHWSFPTLSNSCRPHGYGHRASENCCASNAFCRGHRRNRESHGICLCHRACLSPGFSRGTSCGLSSGRGGRLRSACRHVGHRSGHRSGRRGGRRSGRAVWRRVCRSVAACTLGDRSSERGDALARSACWDAPLCYETRVWERECL
jgi:hypothetical protein